ncbi:hypothetical protein V2J09_001997 [Rumex salicifolius]
MGSTGFDFFFYNKILWFIETNLSHLPIPSAALSFSALQISPRKAKPPEGADLHRRRRINAMMETDASGSDAASASPAASVARWSFVVTQRFQHLLDKSTPFVLRRWIGVAVLAFVYALRVLLIQGFYVVSYALGIYILNLLIAFLSPQEDPEIHGATLPTRRSDEFRPFVRRLPEFKYSLTKAFCIAFLATFFEAFDVPVFWPILVFYWFMLFTLTMRRQIQHMIKYRYVPFTFGKKRYDGKRPTAEESAPLVKD